MKKNVISYIIIICSLISSSVLCNEFKDLKTRLEKISEFHAFFDQKVIDNNGNLLQKGQGELWVKTPRFFNLHMIYPDESTLVLDGKTLWFHSSLLNQVTAISLQDVVEDTPFILIFGNHVSDWKKYYIEKIGDNFILTPKKNNGSLKKFIINVNCDGKIRHFTLVEQSGKVNKYQLTLQKNSMIDESKFIFIPPSGVVVDDQRNK